MSEKVDHPAHYRADTGHEAIDVIEAWGLGFNLGSTVKYLARCGFKDNSLEDLRKASWYLAREIANREPSTVPSGLEAYTLHDARITPYGQMVKAGLGVGGNSGEPPITSISEERTLGSECDRRYLENSGTRFK